MPASQVIRQERRGRVELKVSGSFDGAAAWELSARLADEHEPVLVDFSQVTHFNDYSLAVLANAVTDRKDRSLSLVGLRQHQLRMLHYLGCDVDDLGTALQHAEAPLEVAVVAAAQRIAS